MVDSTEFFRNERTTKKYFDYKDLQDIKEEYYSRIDCGDHILGGKDYGKGGISACSDYIIFKELSEISKENKKDIIYVTDDEKEKKYKYHEYEIQDDFYCETGQRIYFFNINNLIQFLNIELTKEEEEINRSISRDMNNNKEILNSLVSQTLLNYANLQNLPFYKNLNRFAEAYKYPWSSDAMRNIILQQEKICKNLEPFYLLNNKNLNHLFKTIHKK